MLHAGVFGLLVIHRRRGNVKVGFALEYPRSKFTLQLLYLSFHGRIFLSQFIFLDSDLKSIRIQLEVQKIRDADDTP